MSADKKTTRRQFNADILKNISILTVRESCRLVYYRAIIAIVSISTAGFNPADYSPKEITIRILPQTELLVNIFFHFCRQTVR